MKTLIYALLFMMFSPLMLAQTDDDAKKKAMMEKADEAKNAVNAAMIKAEETKEALPQAPGDDPDAPDEATPELIETDVSESTESAMATEMSEEEMMMMKWQESLKIGEKHDRLSENVGEYTYVNTFWMDPQAPPMTSEGTCKIEPIMDGRYYLETHKGEMMNSTFNGMAIVGYDNVTEQYVSSWIDNMGTGIMKFTGNYNEQEQLETTAETVNPMTGAKEVHRIVMTQGSGGYTMDYFIDADGASVHSMNVEYTKVK